MFAVFNHQNQELASPGGGLSGFDSSSSSSSTSSPTPQSPLIKVDLSPLRVGGKNTLAQYRNVTFKARSIFQGGILSRHSEEAADDGDKPIEIRRWGFEQDKLCQLLGQLANNNDADNLVGMKELLRMANSDLVNTRFEGSVAETLLFENGTRSSEKLQSLYMYYFCESLSIRPIHRELAIPDLNTKRVDGDNGGKSTTMEDGSTVSIATDPFNESSIHSDETDPLRESFRLPAMQVLVSSLQLMLRRRQDYGIEFDFENLSPFWSCMTTAMSELIASPMFRHSILASLCLKAFALLTKMHPETIGPIVKASVLPHVHLGNGSDRFIRREAVRLLKLYK